jgi:drug/metabolite transporter (DMT)-like permease
VLLVTYVAPVLVALVAPRLLGERVQPAVLAALGVAVVGSMLVLGPGASGAPAAGIALALVAAVLLAVLIVNAKILSRYHDGVRLAFLQVAVATATLLPVVAVDNDGWPSPVSLGWLVVLGLVHTAAALVVYFQALGRIPATSVSVLAYLEPAAGVLFAWWILSEQPSVATIIGGGLIMVAGLLVVRAGGDSGPPATASVARYH